jgi:hypothetical protein
MRLRFHWLLWSALSAVFLFVFISPVIWPKPFETPLFAAGSVQLAMRIALLALCPIVAWLALSGEGLTSKGKLGAFFLVLAATAICEVIHYWVTDRGHYFGPAQFADNTAWQWFMHGPIMRLEYGALPHSYRFLPDAAVQLFMWLCGDFVVARIAFRLVFTALLFVAIFRYARTYVPNVIAGLAVLLIVAIYPLTILKYAGQFIDPLSHLSFVVCLLCLARRYEPGFGPSLFVGLFAKEAVIVMAICRAFYGPSRLRSSLLAGVYLAGALAIVGGIRMVVNHGHMGYDQISGVGWSHIPENLGGYPEWGLIYFAAYGALLPGAILGWKYMDIPFRLTALFVTAAMLVSSLMFSWMSEMRNSMPAFVLLAVINAVYVDRLLAASISEAKRAPTGTAAPHQ